MFYIFYLNSPEDDPKKIETRWSLGGLYLLPILHYFDWLAAFHLELLQAILFIAV